MFVSMSLSMSSAHAHDTIKFFDVKIGYIEYNADPKKRYIFRWDGHEEVFKVLSAIDILSAKGNPVKSMYVIPDLKDFGVRTSSGLICEFGTGPPEVAIQKFMELHPKEIGAALIFEGVAFPIPNYLKNIVLAGGKTSQFDHWRVSFC